MSKNKRSTRKNARMRWERRHHRRVADGFPKVLAKARRRKITKNQDGGGEIFWALESPDSWIGNHYASRRTGICFCALSFIHVCIHASSWSFRRINLIPGPPVKKEVFLSWNPAALPKAKSCLSRGVMVEERLQRNYNIRENAPRRVGHFRRR